MQSERQTGKLRCEKKRRWTEREKKSPNKQGDSDPRKGDGLKERRNKDRKIT